MVGWWPFDEVSGTGVGDLSGTSPLNQGSLYGPLSSSRWRNDGILETALRFNGQENYISVPNSPSLGRVGKPDYGATIQLWMRSSSSLPSHQQLFNKSSSTQGISLNLDANSRSLHLEVGAPSVSAAADGSTDLVDDNWHFLAATIGNGALGAYIDGQREGSGSYPGSPDFSSDVATAPVGLGDVLHYIN